jgi:RNA polymerase sigma-B factor
LSPALKTTPDRELIERWQTRGDADAREVLVERYRGLVRALAARYVDRGEPFDDLVQVAWIGLLKSIDRFDSSRDVQLTTYATPTIVGEIKRHYRDRAWAVHVPRSLQEMRVRVHATIDRLTSERGAAPTVADIAKELGATDEEVLDALQSENARSATFLPTADDERDERGLEFPVEELGFSRSDARVMLSAGLADLDDRDRRILRLRFEEGLTQSQIAAKLGISQMHVSRLLRRSLEALRESVGEIDELPGE